MYRLDSYLDCSKKRPLEKSPAWGIVREALCAVAEIVPEAN
jgi:hypothetical protein